MTLREQSDAAYLEYKALCRQLREMGAGSGHMGLTPDSIKFSPEFREIKARATIAFNKLRRINTLIARQR